jgi:hypothetical protein
MFYSNKLFQGVFMKKILFGLLSLTMALFLAGCIRPYNAPAAVQIQTNEVAFLVNMTDDTTTESGTDKLKEIQVKDILVKGYWVQTGRFHNSGYYRPEQKVIVVSQAPVRLDWDETHVTKTINMTSIESSGFIVPMTINAYIASDEDARKYLQSFKPTSNENINWNRLSSKEWAPYIKESAQPLEIALNTVVYTKVLEMLNVLFVRTPIIKAEIASKVFIPAIYDGMTSEELNEQMKLNGIDAIFTSDIFSIKNWAKEQYGITITAMAPMDGVIFNDQAVQTEIDSLAVGKMRENTLDQNRLNEIKEAAIALVKAQSETAIAREKAAQAQALRSLQEIENSKIIAEAEAEAIKAGKYRPVPGTVVVQSLDAYGTLVK